jgi:hypothetical protein
LWRYSIKAVAQAVAQAVAKGVAVKYSLYLEN